MALKYRYERTIAHCCTLLSQSDLSWYGWPGLCVIVQHVVRYCILSVPIHSAGHPCQSGTFLPTVGRCGPSWWQTIASRQLQLERPDGDQHEQIVARLNAANIPLHDCDSIHECSLAMV
jgi:hypothetical protein